MAMCGIGVGSCKFRLINASGNSDTQQGSTAIIL